MHLRPWSGTPAPCIAPNDNFYSKNMLSGGKVTLIFFVKVMIKITPQRTASEQFAVKVK
jgi:hypothetical protein